MVVFGGTGEGGSARNDVWLLEWNDPNPTRYRWVMVMVRVLGEKYLDQSQT